MPFEPEEIIAMKNYGHIDTKLKGLLEQRGISKNRLKQLTGTSYNVVARYCSGEQLGLVDLDFLSRVCCVLRCDLGDLLEYKR